jgi:hypothetical protein
MREHANAFKNGGGAQRAEDLRIVGGRGTNQSPNLDGILRVSIGCSLQEALAWTLLVSLWSIFLAFVAGVTIGEYFSSIILPCKVVGVIGVATGAFVASWLIVLRTNCTRNGSDLKGTSLSSDW